MKSSRNRDPLRDHNEVEPPFTPRVDPYDKRPAIARDDKSLRPGKPHLREPVGIGSSSERLLTVQEAAAYLRLSKSFLDKARLTGTGPAFVRLGRKILYRPQDMDDWVRQRRYGSTSEYVD